MEVKLIEISNKSNNVKQIVYPIARASLSLIEHQYSYFALRYLQSQKHKSWLRIFQAKRRNKCASLRTYHLARARSKNVRVG